MHTFEIRQTFLSFYQHMGFFLLPSAPMLHPSTPMSFVMSAGLPQIEVGLANFEDHPKTCKYVLTQNCFRHFDVERVGTDNLHLSFFEMPGAFILGERRRDQAIQKMWLLLTEHLRLDPSRLWASYFSGGEKAGHQFAADASTLEAWMEIGIPKYRVVGLGPNHNYWIQGDGIDGLAETRKCGANTEVFWDRGTEYSCSTDCGPGCRCGRFVEIANSLFINNGINRFKGEVEPLDVPFIETVIGIERIAMMIQNKGHIFEIDLFEPLIHAINTYGRYTSSTNTDCRKQIHIIADHLRALLYLVADGAPPPWGENSNKGGRYRLVRILIRRVLTAKIILGINSSDFIRDIINVMIQISEEKPKLENAREILLSYFAVEAQRFGQTLSRGLRELNRLVQNNSLMELSDSKMLYLEKNCGFPRDLIEWELERRGLDIITNSYQHTWQDWKDQIA